MLLSRPALIVPPPTIYQTRRMTAKLGLCLESQGVGSLRYYPLSKPRACLRTRTWGEHRRWPGDSCPPSQKPSLSQKLPGGVATAPGPALTSLTQSWQTPMAPCQFHGGGCGCHHWGVRMRTNSRSLSMPLNPLPFPGKYRPLLAPPPGRRAFAFTVSIQARLAADDWMSW